VSMCRVLPDRFLSGAVSSVSSISDAARQNRDIA
jgi:hypothetical protein